MSSPPRAGAVVVYLAAGLVAGAFMATQSHINGALAVETHDPPVTALISFGVGTIVMLIVTVLSRRTRVGMGLVLAAIRERRLAWIYTLAGVSGAAFVFSQSLVVGVTGVALFTVAFVCGLMIGSYALDLWGVGPAGKRPASLLRTIGTVVALIAVVVETWGQFGNPQGLVLILLPLVFGFLVSWQQIANGLIAVVAKTPMTPTLINFLVGTGVLALLAAIATLASGTWPASFPTDWWLYLGGPCGVIFVSLTAWVVRHIGALVTSLATTAGNLLMAVIFDLVFPSASVDIVTMLLGALIMLVALALATSGRARSLAQK